MRNRPTISAGKNNKKYSHERVEAFTFSSKFTKITLTIKLFIIM